MPDREELLLILGSRARAGNVAAIKALPDELRREDDTGPDSDDGDALAAGWAEFQARRNGWTVRALPEPGLEE